MSTLTIILLVGMFLVLDVVLVGAILSMAGEPWRALGAAFPPVEPAHDAVKRNFQSFSIGLSNWGGCVHVSVDEHHMHLRPAMLMRWARLPGCSVPWDRVRVSKVRGKHAHARVGNTELIGPAWALTLGGGGGEGVGRGEAQS